MKLSISLFINCLLILAMRVTYAQNSSGCNCDYTITKGGVYANSTLKVPPGKTVCIQAGRYEYLRFNGFVGAPGQPIRFVNCGGQVSVGINAYYSGIQFNASRYFVLSGSGDETYPYGIKLDQSYAGASGLSIGGLSSDCEVERVEVAAAGFAGFMVKTDPSCDASTWRENFTMYNVKLHDNYIHDISGPGMFLGSGYTNGVTLTCSGESKTVYASLISGLEVYNNLIEQTTGAGYQVNNAPDAQVHDNTLINTGKTSVSGFQVGGSSACGCDYTINKGGVYTNSTLKVPPGKTVCIQAGHYEYLRFNGFVGAPGQPIRFVNCGGQVSVGINAYYSGIQFNASRYFVLSGSGDETYPYGIKLDQSYAGASGLSIGGLSSDCEVERVEVAAAGFAGFMVKTDPSCDASTWRENFTMYNVKLHDNYIHDTGGEGLYIGNSFYNGVTVNCNGVSKIVYPHLIQGLETYNNRIERTGAEGLQYGCAPDAQVHNNTIQYAGISPFANYQNNGLQISSGSGGVCYSNTIKHVSGTGLIVIGHLGNNSIYNNVIYDVGQDGIFCDDRPGSLPNTSMAFLNNTITKVGRDGMRLYNEINTNTIANNVITYMNASPSLNGKAFVFQQGATASMSTNFTAVSSATAGFVNDSIDFRLTASSVLINAGTNVSSWQVITDMAGNPREAGYDIGAYEFTPGSSTSNVPNPAQARLGSDAETRLAEQGFYTPAEPSTNSSLASVIVYPSPTSDQVTLIMPQDQFIRKVLVYNSMGQKVMNQPSTHQYTNTLSIKVSHLPAGTYFVDILTTSAQTLRGRFVKQ